MTRIYSKRDVLHALGKVDLLVAAAEAYAAYSGGTATIPPVGELVFDAPPGDMHIKYGHLHGSAFFVIKVACGFYRNPELGLDSSSGLLLVFCKQTGHAKAILLDEGALTDIRTAAAGAVAARLLANPPNGTVGVLGTGIQARLQAQLLHKHFGVRMVLNWGRRDDAMARYQMDLADKGIEVVPCRSVAEVAAGTNLIVCTTPSARPLLKADHLRPGMHITAIGADSPQKNEVDAEAFRRFDIIGLDSISQAWERGDLHHASGMVAPNDPRLLELGQVVLGSRPGRTDTEQITIADLTGIATQDIILAERVMEQLERGEIVA